MAEDNSAIDVTGAGVVAYGVYSRELNQVIPQHSTVRRNAVLSAGNNMYVGVGADAIGSCNAPRDGGMMPCLDRSTERDFDGLVVSANQFFTGPYTRISVGQMIGGGIRWGNHRVVGSGAVFQDNGTGEASARVNIGAAIYAMKDATVSGSLGSLELVDSTSSIFLGCPTATVAIGSTEASTVAGAPEVVGATPDDAPDGCLLPDPSPIGLERIVLSSDQERFVSASTGTEVRFWGTGVPDVISAPWEDVVSTLVEHRRMGFNSLRLLLEAEDFLTQPAAPDGLPGVDTAALSRLGDVIELAEDVGLYIDITGLGIAFSADNGSWYDVLADDADRWAAQQVFWSAVSDVARSSPAVAFYDLMNEPTIPTSVVDSWCFGFNSAGVCWIQELVKDPDTRTSIEIGRSWLEAMTGAIDDGGMDADRLASVGTIFCGGALNITLTEDLIDFAIIHRYPTNEGLAADVGYVEGCAAATDRPLVVEETAVVSGSAATVESFVQQIGPTVEGIYGQSPTGMTPAEIEVRLQSDPPLSWEEAIRLSMMRDTLVIFVANGGSFLPYGSPALRP